MKDRLIEVFSEHCRGCRLCEMACSFHHERECSTTKSRIRILKDNEWAFDCPMLCIQCADAPCIASCSSGALFREEGTQVVRVEGERCIGCGDCIDACPLRALFLQPDTGTVIKCDLCGGGPPECVKWCPNGALTFREVKPDSPTRRAFMDQAASYLKIIDGSTSR